MSRPPPAPASLQDGLSPFLWLSAPGPHAPSMCENGQRGAGLHLSLAAHEPCDPGQVTYTS